MKRIRRVLHPSDFSEASRAALATAIDVARDERAELLIVHVLTPVVPPAIGPAGDGYIPPAAWEDLVRSSRSLAQRKLAGLVARAARRRVRASALLVEGVADAAITRAARSRGADLIVMGTHGRTGLARLFLGSVAARVLGTAPCPVLTVRGR